MYDADDIANMQYAEYRDTKKHMSYSEKMATAKSNGAFMSRLLRIEGIKKQRKGNNMTVPTFNIKKRDNAPDFVVGSFGCKMGDIEPFVNGKGYINFDILKGKESGMYVKINTYGLDKDEETETVTKIGEISEDEIAF